MRNIRITIQYDGTHYAGWQRQKSEPTIQEKLEDAVCKITGHSRCVVHGSGRTDAGVHALGQVANFQTSSTIPADAVAPALNSHLPDDIVVIDARQVSDTFHARKSARSKRYRYTILRRKYTSPLQRLYAVTFHGPLDVKAMRQAAKRLVGTHDFSAFASKSRAKAHAPLATNVRNLTSLDITEAGEQLVFDVRASGFLYNMVRAIVGTLLEVGQGKMESTQVGDILHAGQRARAGSTAPAKGLCLMEVDY